MAEQFATAWEGFAAGDWQNEVNVRDFIQKITLHMKVMNLSWFLRVPKQHKNFGLR